MISINKVYTGYDDNREAQLRYDWNSLLCDDDEMKVSRYSRQYFPDASDYVKYLQDFAKRFELNIKYQTRAISVKRDSNQGI